MRRSKRPSHREGSITWRRNDRLFGLPYYVEGPCSLYWLVLSFILSILVIESFVTESW
jgi:hypothetical protein